MKINFLKMENLLAAKQKVLILNYGECESNIQKRMAIPKGQNEPAGS
jgi:hypothetical protein